MLEHHRRQAQGPAVDLRQAAAAEPITNLTAWDDERLPGPTARDVTAAVSTSAAVDSRWRRMAGRLEIRRTAEVSVLADGAKWICGEAAKNLPGATGVLDVYHACEHLHAAAAARHGESPAAAAWYGTRRRRLLRESAAGVLAELAAEPGPDPGLAEYLTPHIDHIPSRERLTGGRSIGSGLVEGAW